MVSGGGKRGCTEGPQTFLSFSRGGGGKQCSRVVLVLTGGLSTIFFSLSQAWGEKNMGGAVGHL